MSVWVAVFLGVLQGLTEFFPVSSSGHLALFGAWFGMKDADLTFEILVHMATLGAIVVYFRKDWIQLFQVAIGKERGDFPPHIFLYVLVSMIPAGLVGIFLKDQIEWIHGQTFYVGIFLLVTGTMLLAGLKIPPEGKAMDKLSLAVVIAMGCAQAFAVLPGISRSGSTIMCALFLGMSRQAGARFSFLMAVPVIGGAGLLMIKDLVEDGAALGSDMLIAYGAGFVAALISGFFALAFLMKLLEGNRFFFFGFYCLPMGILAMVL
ncbi:undecaprenyl-diphosphate phosphatase [Acanthopleuribacter pedis]|uniref:Undecaprenyl-diphosphatase n=1 Tax=Acanthopleuribacter pedis TaxID=442870 RepID=A0A8J7QLJ2_9BACT|nr:undecaprenyl-diphosphate phosphatase [Acanthopleuribacter pedis]